MILIEPRWFKEVKTKLGYKKALEELSKAFPGSISSHHWIKASNLDELFSWQSTPQGHCFWSDISHAPYDYRKNIYSKLRKKWGLPQ